jgi:hypothetical protein
MSEAFFRLKLENKAANYYFMCGGTIKEIIGYMRAEDTNRNDGNLIAPELEQVFARALKLKKEQFFVKPYDNGLVTTLLYECEVPTDPQADLLLKALFDAFKPMQPQEDNDNDGK